MARTKSNGNASEKFSANLGFTTLRDTRLPKLLSGELSVATGNGSK